MSLSQTAINFREAYISVMIMEALALTSQCDTVETIKSLEAEYADWTFRDVVQQAILDGFIDNADEIYADT